MTLGRTCRSCGAEIAWGVNEQTRRRMPLDPDIVMTGLRFAVVGQTQDEQHGLVDVVAKTDVGPGRVSHFATCPNAGQHRRKR